MATEILQKARSEFAAQTSTSLTADQVPGDGSYSDTNCVVIDNTYNDGDENSRGAEALHLVLDVTTDPAANTSTADIYYQTSENNSDYTLWKYSHTVGTTIQSDGTTEDRIDAGLFVMTSTYAKLAVACNDNNFICVLYATPLLMEAQ